MAEGTIEVEDNVSEVKAMPILIQGNKNILIVSCALEGAPLSVYDVGGRQIASTRAVNGMTEIPVIATDSLIIVKISDKTVKVRMK